MARRFETFYKTQRLDNLGDPDWHDRRWEDVDRRMHARELDATAIEGAVDRMESVALQRLNDTFSPIIAQAMNQLADVGVSFTGESVSEHVVGLGTKTFVITEDFRVGLVVVDFVSIRPTGVPAVAMICAVTSYDRATGALVVEPQVGYITGSGTYSDWQIKVSVTPNLDTYTREEVNGLFDALVGAAPANLNTLEKISISIGGDSDVVGSLMGALCQRTNNLGDLSNTAAARTNIGLGNVNNTSDLAKPVSNATTAAINAATAAVFPVGTQMLFFNAVVPTGWIRLTTHHDKTIRVVNSTGAGAGGVLAWSTVFGRTTTDNTTLNINQIPAHAHSVYDPTHTHNHYDPTHAHSVSDPTHYHYSYYTGFVQAVGGQGEQNALAGTGTNTEAAYTGIGIYANYASTSSYASYSSVSLYNNGGSGAHLHGIDLRCQYVDVLIGTKA
jgi:hypothetical protein